MIKDVLIIIPAVQRETAHTALTAALGATPINAVMPMAGGNSGAFVFNVVAGDRRYVLRIEGTPSPLRNPHQYASMRIAAEAGIAPRIHYLDENARVVVMDFIKEQPLKSFQGGPSALAHSVGQLIRRSQTTPSFPAFVEYPAIVGRLWEHVCRTAVFMPGLLDTATERLAEIRDTYTWNADETVSSHNDLLPRNLLFDGKRLWLIDWESAYRNDPLVDVATALDNFAAAPELEEVLLRAWLGRAPDQKLRDRLALVQALTRLYYAGVLFSAVATAPRGDPESELSALTATEFEQAIRSARLKPETPEASLALGKMFLASFMTGKKPPGLPPMYMR